MKRLNSVVLILVFMDILGYYLNILLIMYQIMYLYQSQKLPSKHMQTTRTDMAMNCTTNFEMGFPFQSMLFNVTSFLSAYIHYYVVQNQITIYTL